MDGGVLVAFAFTRSGGGGGRRISAGRRTEGGEAAGAADRPASAPFRPRRRCDLEKGSMEPTFFFK
jgi:hypothetical protein